MLGREHEVGAAEEVSETRREDLELAGGDRLQLQIRSAGALCKPADPGLLHALGRVRPIDPGQIGEQPVGVRGDAQDPLAQIAPLHRKTADLAFAVDHFLVGEDVAAIPGTLGTGRSCT